MPTQTLGKVKLTPRGAYDPAATYVPLDIVSYGGGSYCVLKNVTGVTPTGDDVNYQLLAKSGADGKSPQISASKTWLVWDANKGEYVDTGVSAAGEKGDAGAPGKAPIIGSNGNWYVWDDASGAYTDTGKPSRGEKGDTGAAGADGADGADGRDGITPTIGENGNWYLGATDTGKPSRGKDGATGAPGATGEKGADGKSAYAYAVQGGYTGTETEFAAKLAEKMPTALPNPNALTFTGAVTGSYDGSAPLSVEIPSGGGSGGGTLEQILDFTITEEAAYIYHEFEPAITAKELLILITANSPSALANAGASIVLARLNVTDPTSQWNTGGIALENLPKMLIAGATRDGFYRIENFAGGAIVTAASQEVGTKGVPSIVSSDISTISNIRVDTQNWSNNFAAGSRIRIYGVMVHEN